ncbi:MAG TPA: pilus assembly protein TadG-related protein [Candidatus Dormibacteraeota bacterium]
MRKQQGQAIVLIAIMLAVVVGMAALAIDGSRAYALRRDLQAAVDAAALAAGDNLQQTGLYSSAEAAATAIFDANARLYSGPTSCSGYLAPDATHNPRTITCNYSDGTVLTQVVTALGPAGTQFTIAASRSLVLQFARILTNGTTPRLSATGSGGVNNLLYTPTIAALSQAGCGGMPGSAITTTTGGTLEVVGDMVSSGAISIAGSAQVVGDVYARCQSSVPGVTTFCYPSGNPIPCTFPDIAGRTKSGYNFVDPNYPQPAVTGSSMGAPGNPAVIQPGTYAADPGPAFVPGRCYFLAAGVYQWLHGYTNNGAYVSNELRPPDEPVYNNTTVRDGHQLWNTDGNCAGAFQASGIGGSPIITREGTWGIVLTSVRTDTYNGVSYTRESAPSFCHTVVVGDFQVIQIQVSNVPGATSYNVYAAPPTSGCSGPFGLAGSITVPPATPGPVPQETGQNENTAGCPVYSGTGCSLGNETAIFNASLLGLGFNPNCGVAPGFYLSCPPSGETAPLRSNLPNENANRAAPPFGDRANENACQTVGRALTPCPDAITPGAVAFVIPSGGCVNDSNNGDVRIFSGYQYNWMALYEPGAGNPPANTCSNFLGAATDSAFIGLVYTPSAAITVNKASAFRTDEVGGVIAYTLTFSSQLPTIIGNAADYGPLPPGARLTG